MEGAHGRPGARPVLRAHQRPKDRMHQTSVACVGTGRLSTRLRWGKGGWHRMIVFTSIGPHTPTPPHPPHPPHPHTTTSPTPRHTLELKKWKGEPPSPRSDPPPPLSNPHTPLKILQSDNLRCNSRVNKCLVVASLNAEESCGHGFARHSRVSGIVECLVFVLYKCRGLLISFFLLLVHAPHLPRPGSSLCGLCRCFAMRIPLWGRHVRCRTIWRRRPKQNFAPHGHNNSGGN